MKPTFPDTHLGKNRFGSQRRQWQPTPVLLPGKSYGQRSLVGCSPWGCRRVGHGWATSLSLFTFMPWKRKWEPTPMFLPGESQGQGSLVGCHLRDCTDLDMTEATSQQQVWKHHHGLDYRSGPSKRYWSRHLECPPFHPVFSGVMYVALKSFMVPL